MTEQTYPATVDASELTGDDKEPADLTVSEVARLPWDSERANNDRALAALGAAKAYGADRKNLDQPTATVLGDLITDMRHLADALGIDFAWLVDGTYDDYREELYDQPDAGGGQRTGLLAGEKA